MKRLALLLTLALASSASASPTLTLKHARFAVRASAEQTIGTLLYRSTGSAPVRVSRCHVHGRRGRCHVDIVGTSRCSYTAHALLVGHDGDIAVWGDSVRCQP